MPLYSIEELCRDIDRIKYNDDQTRIIISSFRYSSYYSPSIYASDHVPTSGKYGDARYHAAYRAAAQILDSHGIKSMAKTS